MATTNFLTVIKDGIEYHCSMYPTENEAMIEDGSTVQVSKDGEFYYLGLSPEEREYTSPLRAIKDNAIYYVITEIPETPDEPDEPQVEYVTIKVTPSLHQTITFTCNGVDATIGPSDEEKTFTIPVGATYSFTVEPEEGYIAGTIEGMPENGTIAEDDDGKTVTFTDAEIEEPEPEPTEYTITVTKDANIAGVTIVRNDTEEEIVSGAKVPENTVLTITATAEEGFNEPTITITNI